MGEMVIVVVIFIWLILGVVVVDACRIWRTWWIDVNPLSAALWPLVLFTAFKNGPDR